jgi:3-phenylpropionate/trans-cinnamate dioxygenase ferredoxin subunit
VRYVVAGVDEIPPGQRKIVEVAGRSIGIFNVRGELFALRNRCPHQGGPLCEGKLWSGVTASAPGRIETVGGASMIACGWHTWEFDLRTGQSWCDPARLRVRRYDVEVAAGAAIVAEDRAAPTQGKVEGPYVAETYPVTLDGEYVVVDIPT